MLGFYDGIEERIFSSSQEFLDSILTDRYRSYTIYAHNAERFDFKFIIEDILKMEVSDNKIEAVNGKILEIKFIQSGERIREIVIRDQKRHYWKFADSFWLIPCSLKKAAESFKVETQKGEFDYDKISINDYKSRRYCLDDCRALFECIAAYFARPLFKGLKPKGTIASNAMQIYKANIKTTIKGIDREQENFIRGGYYGGRVEIFKLYGEGLNYYDFNSLYPFTMVNHAFPIGLPCWVDTWTGEPGFYDCTAEIPSEVYIPPLPIVREGKLIFPVGRFRGIFSSCELEAAMEIGAKIKVHQGLVFHQSKSIFNDYVADLYALKAKSDRDSADYMISKLYLNGLYGKFGQKREQVSIVRCDSMTAAGRGLTPYMPDFGLWIEKSQSRGAYIMPNIAAWVTAQARLHLYRHLNKQSYYCDTDSIFTTDTHRTDETQLGALKLEKRVNRAYFILPKFYRLETGTESETKAKGFGRDFVKDIKESDFKRALNGDYSGFSVKKMRILGIKESLKRFKRSPISMECIKTIKSTYNKREILKNLDTRAWVLNESA